MSGQLNGDVEVMQNLSRAVEQFGAEVEAAVSQLQSAADEAGEGWQDHNYEQAHSDIAEMLSGLNVSESASTIAQFISQKAAYYSEG
jgi:hypothetical protein